MTRISRRRVLLGVAGAAVAAALGAAGAGMLRGRTDTTAEHVGEMLRFLLHKEPISDAVIAQFARDFASRRSHFGTSAKGNALKVLAWLPYADFRRVLSMIGGGARRNRQNRIEAQMLTKFLLSTSYFDSGTAGGAPVVYRQYYDPYDAACMNPLATFDS
jgi:hypothetical protein